MGRFSDAVLFDLDGVLVDSRAAITGCLNHALAAHGQPERRERELYRFIGPPLALAFAELTAAAPDSSLVLACVSSYRKRYAVASLRETTVIDGITDVLADLGRHHSLAVATSKPLAFAEPLLCALGLRDFFEAVAAAGLAAHGEDKATTIGTALTELAPRRAVMVGDRSFDIAGARAHGIPAVGVTWGIGDRIELSAAGADAIVDAPAELPGAVLTLLRGLAA